MQRDNNSMRLQQMFREAIRVGNYSYATEKAYWAWIRSFLHYHSVKHPSRKRTPIDLKFEKYPINR